MPLVERDDQLGVLDGLAEGLPSGSVAVIGAEAGAGKTSLLSVFTDRLPRGVVHRSGRCDDLSTPASFAPLWDMAAALPGEVVDALRQGGRAGVLASITDALRSAPSVLMLDDVQWADDATIDLIRYVGRRVTELPVVLCLAYRSDEVSRDHPLQRALGELTPQSVRITIPALTLPGVAQLAGRDTSEVATVYARSGGNPFFVTELLSSDPSSTPDAVSDAVLARAAALPSSAWAVLEVAALAPQGVDHAMLPAIGPEAEGDADLAVERGLLQFRDARLRCRHDLVRAALAATVPPLRHRRVNAALAEWLAPRAATRADIAQVAAHAVAADDGPRAAVFSHAAAQHASGDGAHREAVRHATNALGYRAHLAPEQTRQALEIGARSGYFVHDMEFAFECARELWAADEAPAPAVAADRAWWCSRLAHFADRHDDAVRFAEAAEAAWEAAGDDTRSEYARWWLATLDSDRDGIAASGRRALDLAHATGADEVAAHILVGAHATGGEQERLALIQEGVELALQCGSLEQAARGYNNLVYLTTIWRHVEAADRWLDEGLTWTAEHDMDFWWDGMIDTRAQLRLSQGRWEESLHDAALTIEGRVRSASMQLCARVARASILLRRGDPAAQEAVVSAVEAGEGSVHERLIAAPVLAEQAWIADDRIAAEALAAELAAAAGQSEISLDPWLVGPVVFWLARLDRDLVGDSFGAGLPRPVAIEMTGDLAAAGQAWRDLGCPFEAAVVDASSDDRTLMRTSLDDLTRLGAVATVTALRRDALRRGMRAVPRGMRETTALDPDGLTPRQTEVLALLGERLTDAQIAGRLMISEKTAGHHVSAILARLGVGSRSEAGAHARMRLDEA